jgi:hypothetical protein
MGGKPNGKMVEITGDKTVISIKGERTEFPLSNEWMRKIASWANEHFEEAITGHGPWVFGRLTNNRQDVRVYLPDSIIRDIRSEIEATKRAAEEAEAAKAQARAKVSDVEDLSEFSWLDDDLPPDEEFSDLLEEDDEEEEEASTPTKPTRPTNGNGKPLPDATPKIVEGKAVQAGNHKYRGKYPGLDFLRGRFVLGCASLLIGVGVALFWYLISPYMVLFKAPWWSAIPVGFVAFTFILVASMLAEEGMRWRGPRVPKGAGDSGCVLSCASCTFFSLIGLLVVLAAAFILVYAIDRVSGANLAQGTIPEAVAPLYQQFENRLAGPAVDKTEPVSGGVWSVVKPVGNFVFWKAPMWLHKEVPDATSAAWKYVRDIRTKSVGQDIAPTAVPIPAEPTATPISASATATPPTPTVGPTPTRTPGGSFRPS